MIAGWWNLISYPRSSLTVTLPQNTMTIRWAAGFNLKVRLHLASTVSIWWTQRLLEFRWSVAYSDVSIQIPSLAFVRPKPSPHYFRSLTPPKSVFHSWSKVFIMMRGDFFQTKVSSKVLQFRVTSGWEKHSAFLQTTCQATAQSSSCIRLGLWALSVICWQGGRKP